MGEYLADLTTSGPLILGVLAAALAGLVSFASPCVVPLVPGYLSYLTGTVGGEMNYEGEHGPQVGKRRQWAVVLAALLFVLGFTVVFLLATVTVFGVIGTLAVQAETLMRIGGVVTILMGLVFMGLVPGLQRDTRMNPQRWTTWLGAPCWAGSLRWGGRPAWAPR